MAAVVKVFCLCELDLSIFSHKILKLRNFKILIHLNIITHPLEVNISNIFLRKSTSVETCRDGRRNTNEAFISKCMCAYTYIKHTGF